MREVSSLSYRKERENNSPLNDIPSFVSREQRFSHLPNIETKPRPQARNQVVHPHESISQIHSPVSHLNIHISEPADRSRRVKYEIVQHRLENQKQHKLKIATLYIIHRVLEITVNFPRWHGCCLCLAAYGRLSVGPVEVVGDIHPLSGADDVGVIGRGTDADGLCGSAEHVAHFVRQGFKAIGRFWAEGWAEDFVQ